MIGPKLEEEGSPTISRWFLVIIVFVGNRVITNVLVGLMIESVSSVNDDYIKEKREKKNLRCQKKREELSKRMKYFIKILFANLDLLFFSHLGTIQVLNTRFSDTNNKMNTTKNSVEQIKAKLKLIHNEIIAPKDFIFSIDWLEKLISCR